jgi:indolepyruvate ferredoxin oxidoreductase, beta subunit
MADKFDVYMIGVGGQGIGLLSEALARAVWGSGQEVRGVDTHGLAQRGGTVVSQLRVGIDAHTPLIRAHSAELVIAMERNEALRGVLSHAKPGGTLLWYDAVWQPLSVRIRSEAPLKRESIAEACESLGVTERRVFVEDLKDARMQNTAILAAIADGGLIPGITRGNLREALSDLLGGAILANNLSLFDRLSGPVD